MSKPRPSIKRPHEPEVQDLPWEMRDEAMRRRIAWEELAGSSNYNPSSSKAAKLIIPALRYIHRFMAHSIFGQGESTGVVSKRELYLLWAMVLGGMTKGPVTISMIILMKLCRREGGRYLIIIEAGTFVSRPPQAVEEDIPMPTVGASTSQPRTAPQDTMGPSQPPQMHEESPPAATIVTQEMIMAELD
ncbi:hypothetical protein ACLOJK_027105, partial [Asimina triloba]